MSIYLDAIDVLDSRYPYLATHVLNLGKPSYSDGIPTAAMALTKAGIKGKRNIQSSMDIDFELIVNRGFEKMMDKKADDEGHSYAFVLAHECMHLLLGHLTIMRNYDSAMKFNIATDCIINDWLYAHGFKISEAVLQPCRGEFYVGFDAEGSSVDEIYNLLPDEDELGEQFGESGDSLVDDHEDGLMGGQDGSGGGDSQDGNGGGNENTPELSQTELDAMADAVEDMIRKRLENTPDEMKEMIADHNEDLSDLGGMVGGWSPSGFGMQKQASDAGVELKWVDLMNTIQPDLFDRGGKNLEIDRSFARPNRKLMRQYPRVVMPGNAPSAGGFGGNKKGESGFVLALDCSGSIPRDAQRKFQTLAKSIPTDKAKVYACTFSTEYVEFDLERDDNRIAGGGTAFLAVEKFVQDKVVPDLGHYPKSIVVITDGGSSLDSYYGSASGTKPPNDDELTHWYWLMLMAGQRVSDSRVMNVCSDQIFPLNEYVN